jgi:hypothetical protein
MSRPMRRPEDRAPARSSEARGPRVGFPIHSNRCGRITPGPSRLGSGQRLDRDTRCAGPRRAIEAGGQRLEMPRDLVAAEGLGEGPEVESRGGRANQCGRHRRGIQNVRDLAGAGEVGENRRSESDGRRAEIGAGFLLPGQPGPQDRPVRDVASRCPRRTRRRRRTEDPSQDEDPQVVQGHRSGPRHAEIAPVRSGKRRIGLNRWYDALRRVVNGLRAGLSGRCEAQARDRFRG